MIKELLAAYRERFGKDREVDLRARTHFIRSCSWMYAAIFLILYYTGGGGFFMSAIIAFVPAVIMGIPVYLITNWVAKWFGTFYGLREAHWTTDEIIAADLDRIRHSKRSGRFEEALNIANDVLHRFPDHPMVLFLKAQILWEGFGYGARAKRYLQHIMEKVPEKDYLHQWAESYMRNIDRPHRRDTEEKEKADPQSNGDV